MTQVDNLPSLLEFNYEGRPVRTVTVNGEPWFVARDVALILGYSNPQKAVRDHCKAPRRAGDLGVNDPFTPLDPQTLLIPERDVYRLIMRSHLPEAERFEEWVVGEVLPSIRRRGFYALPAHTSQAELALVMAQALVEQERQIRALQATQAQQQEMLTILGHRIDSLDTANIEGDLRQRFERMVKRYAWAKGISYQAAWREFDQAYNTAFRTNLTLLRQNYAERHGLDEISRPEYLERTGKLEDAIRIADKMLAQVNRARSKDAS